MGALKKKNEIQLGTEVSSESQQLQTRKNVKENFTYSLLLGVAEAVEIVEIKGSVPKLLREVTESYDWRKDEFWEAARKVCIEVASQIESGMSVHLNSGGKEISREYARKFRQLQTSLRNDSNSELRLQLLNGDIIAIDLTRMTPEQLAPKSKLEQDKETKRLYFEQRVLPKEQSPIMMKTSAGLEIIQPDSTVKQPLAESAAEIHGSS